MRQTSFFLKVLFVAVDRCYGLYLNIPLKPQVLIGGVYQTELTGTSVCDTVIKGDAVLNW